MIAFHYPPFQGSSGVLRTWNFTRYLPGLSWDPVVVTASTKAYETVQQSGPGVLTIPDGVAVHRATGFDAARHFAIRGRFPQIAALPDRWASWFPFAVRAATRIAGSQRPAVLWSTFPIATAALVGLAVQRLTGLPWVADFRDSMTEESYPSNRLRWRTWRWIESRVVRTASIVVFTTTGTRDMYQERYPEHSGRFHVIPNGYDEESFGRAEALVPRARRIARACIRLVHSGILYPSERDPRPLFEALSLLMRRGEIHAGDLEIVLRATGHDDYLESLISKAQIGAIVKLAPAIPYEDALREMLEADGLLLLQAANSNHQIPAKTYEYFRAGRPIIALTDHAGDTAATLRDAGINTICDIARADEIVAKLPTFLAAIREGTAPIVTRELAVAHSRQSHAKSLSQLFDTLSKA